LGGEDGGGLGVDGIGVANLTFSEGKKGFFGGVDGLFFWFLCDILRSMNMLMKKTFFRILA
jgi:hypothetical protein